MKNINLPNRLTISRMLMIPVFLVFVLFDFGWEPDFLWRVIATAVFILIALTDLLDGRIARARGLVTNFGKFLDPLADKLLIFSAYLALTFRFTEEYGACVYTYVLVWATFLIMFRELAVTSMRMVVSKSSGIVIAANFAGKAKTMAQVVCVCYMLMEPVLFCWFAPFGEWHILSYVILGITLFLTMYSGIKYFLAYLPAMRPDQ